MRTERLLLASLLYAFGVFALAQTKVSDYRPFAEEGKRWTTQVGLVEENIYSYFISGDTVINGENWKKVYNSQYLNDGTPSYYSAVRDAGTKVYCIAKGSSRPRLVYDPYGRIHLNCTVKGGNTFSFHDVYNEESTEVPALDSSDISRGHNDFLYDLLGRPSSELRSGVYIRDGKKYVKH